MTAIDINPVPLGLIPAQNLSVQQMDVRTGGLPPNSHDLVTCRDLVHQFADHAPTVLSQMAAVKPGGWLMIQVPDFHLTPTTEPEAWANTWKALIEWGQSNGVYWLIGRKLPDIVEALGLGHPQAKTDVQNIRGRERGALYFQLFFSVVRDRTVADGHLDAATIDAASALLDDPDYWTQCWMMTAVWIRKPPA